MIKKTKKTKKTNVSKEKKKIAELAQRPLLPGTILSWEEVWAMHRLQKMNPDSPMLLKLPISIALGEWPDGQPKLATHVGFAIDDLDHLKIEFYQITPNGIIDLDVQNLDKHKRTILN